MDLRQAIDRQTRLQLLLLAFDMRDGFVSDREAAAELLELVAAKLRDPSIG